ncbi:3'-5' exonuclease [Paenibacillus abyssi]|uniref:Exonuclease domain-containing protein n=1 Tax=Paenibacillus abyssi TaxID=1340531 RepID=A0A917G1F2_9BACL|nr:3'-5' exonuclease [Paenibacillus abyssi]GGG17716.1 hypothetical protein GCM10010916_38190 [Paenibacillus abyssi]
MNVEHTAIPYFKAWDDVPSGLFSKSALREKGLNPGPLRATVYQRANNRRIELYSIEEATARKPATEKQKQAIERARAAKAAARTCSRCQCVWNKPKDLINGLCSGCRHDVWLENARIIAIEDFRGWAEAKDSYVVVDVETNQLGDGAEIIELSIVDLDENVLFESLIKPNAPVTEEATAIHGITNEMLLNAPGWVEVWDNAHKALEGRTLLIYNAAFDIGQIDSSCRRHQVPFPHLQYRCVMETFSRVMMSYSAYHNNFTWISLADAMQTYCIIGDRSHRSTNDCRNLVKLIREIARNPAGK